MKFVGSLYIPKKEKTNGTLTVDAKDMIGDKNKFIKLKKEKNGDVSFGNYGIDKIVGKGTSSLKGNEKAQNVLYVHRIKHDLLSVGQMCDVDYNIYAKKCEIKKNGSRKIIGRRIRILENVQILEEIQGGKCYIGHVYGSWIWNKRLGHFNFGNMVKICQTHVVRGIPKITRPSNKFCKSCQMGKQRRVSFRTKE